jgi:hypothetical protein
MSAPVTWEGLFAAVPKPVKKPDPKCACCDHLLSQHATGYRTYCEASGLCCCTAFCATAEDVRWPQRVFQKQGAGNREKGAGTDAA